MQDASFGRPLILRGVGLDTAPSRLLIGPFVASIVRINDTTALAVMHENPSVAALPVPHCKALNDVELVEVIASCNVDAEDAIFISAASELLASDAKLLLAHCPDEETASVFPWQPGKFVVGARFALAPDLNGTGFIVRDSEDESDTLTVDAGASHKVVLTVRDRGPFFIGVVFFPKLYVSSSSLDQQEIELLSTSPKQQLRRLLAAPDTASAVGDLHYTFEGAVSIAASAKGEMLFCIDVDLPAYLQQWWDCRTLSVERPTLVLAVITSPAFEVYVNVSLRDGSLLVDPSVSMWATGDAIPISWAQYDKSSCNQTQTQISCVSPSLRRRRGVPDTHSLTAQVVVPALYGGDVNLTIVGWAANADAVTLYTWIAPNLIVWPTPARTSWPNISNITSNRTKQYAIFEDSPRRGLHFVFITLLCYLAVLALRTAYLIYRLRSSPHVGFDRSEVGWQRGLLPLHVWVGLLFPFHYRCANIHTTLACATLMGMYMIVSSAMSSDIADLVVGDTLIEVVLGGVAALMQIFIRPVLNFLFHAYVVLDPMEVQKKSDRSFTASSRYQSVDTQKAPSARAIVESEPEALEAPEYFCHSAPDETCEDGCAAGLAGDALDNLRFEIPLADEALPHSPPKSPVRHNSNGFLREDSGCVHVDEPLSPDAGKQQKQRSSRVGSLKKVHFCSTTDETDFVSAPQLPPPNTRCEGDLGTMNTDETCEDGCAAGLAGDSLDNLRFEIRWRMRHSHTHLQNHRCAITTTALPEKIAAVCTRTSQ